MDAAVPSPPPLPRTLILDYRDSYTNNLLTLFAALYPDDEVKRKVVVIEADEISYEQLQGVLEHVDCVVLSPGPGRPDDPKDIGYALELIKTTKLPLLGVCLGMQALAVAYGGKVSLSSWYGCIMQVDSFVLPSDHQYARPQARACHFGHARFQGSIRPHASISGRQEPCRNGRLQQSDGRSRQW